MKREILDYRRDVSCCCPGHDVFPNETYKNNRSKRARSRDIKKEHRYVRHLRKRQLRADVKRIQENSVGDTAE